MNDLLQAFHAQTKARKGTAAFSKKKEEALKTALILLLCE